jgi:hypothetical protein
MRLRFGELSEAESSARQRIMDRGSEAWLRLSGGDAAGAARLFASIDPRLELGVDRERHAWLSALEASAWPLAELLLAQAPAAFEHSLSLGRAALSLSDALHEIERAHGVDLSRSTLRAGFGRGHLLEVTLGLPGAHGAEIEQIAAENLVRACLGERVFETWIGAVHVTSKPRGGPLRVLDVRTPAARDELQLDELYDTVSAAALGVLRGLPTAPLGGSGTRMPGSRASCSEEQEWTMLEVEPLDGARGLRKDDLLLASTCMPELLRCYLDGAPCSSRRFSRAGEQFVFLSYADRERASERRIARRAQIEVALADCLGEAGVVTGVGLGLHTTYLDFALCNLEMGLTRLIAKLRELAMPPHSFIQFFDTELSEEWLSISPDSRLT